MIPLSIQYRDFPESEAVSASIWDHAEKLERFAREIISCHVTVSSPHRHQVKGRIYHIQVRLHVQGADVVVSREPAEDGSHEDIYVSIRDAFAAARRELEELHRRRRGEVKNHVESKESAFVTKIFLEDGYGFIQTVNEREIYFHENSVVGDSFEELKVGDEVRFSEEMGEKGPQVTSMRVVGKRGSNANHMGF